MVAPAHRHNHDFQSLHLPRIQEVQAEPLDRSAPKESPVFLSYQLSSRAERSVEVTGQIAAELFFGRSEIPTKELNAIRQTFNRIGISLTSHPLGSLTARVSGIIEGALLGLEMSDAAWKDENESSFRRRLLYADLDQNALSRCIYAKCMRVLTGKESSTIWMDADGWPNNFNGRPMLEALGESFARALTSFEALCNQSPTSEGVVERKNTRLQLRLDESHFHHLPNALKYYYDPGILTNIDRIIVSRTSSASEPLAVLEVLEDLKREARSAEQDSFLHQLSSIGLTIFLEDNDAVENTASIVAKVLPRIKQVGLNPEKDLWIGFGFSDLNKDCGGIGATQLALKAIRDVSKLKETIAGVLLGGSQSPERGRFTTRNLRAWADMIRKISSELKVEFTLQDDLMSNLFSGESENITQKSKWVRLALLDEIEDFYQLAQSCHKEIQELVGPALGQARLLGIGGEPFSARPAGRKGAQKIDPKAFYETLRAIPVVHDHYSLGLPIVAADLGCLIERAGQKISDTVSQIKKCYPFAQEILEYQSKKFCPEVFQALYPFLKVLPKIDGREQVIEEIAKASLKVIAEWQQDSMSLPILAKKQRSHFSQLSAVLEPDLYDQAIGSLLLANSEALTINSWVKRAFEAFKISYGIRHSGNGDSGIGDSEIDECYHELLRKRALECCSGRFDITSVMDDILTLERGFYG